jgi:hypothetical protein
MKKIIEDSVDVRDFVESDIEIEESIKAFNKFISLSSRLII